VWKKWLMAIIAVLAAESFAEMLGGVIMVTVTAIGHITIATATTIDPITTATIGHITGVTAITIDRIGDTAITAGGGGANDRRRRSADRCWDQPKPIR
jgi:hypothetical protein